MKKNSKEKLFTYGLFTLLILMFAGMFVYGLNSVLSMEGAFPPVINEEGLTPAPESNVQVVDYLEKVIQKAAVGKPMVTVAGYFDIDDESIKVTGDDEIMATVLYVLGSFEDKLSENGKSGTVHYGNAANEILNIPDVAASDISSFTCDYIYYACTSCEAESTVPQDSCTACGNVYPYVMKYRDEYTITIQLTVNDRLLDGNFGRRTADDIKNLYADGFQGFLSVQETGPTYQALTIVFCVNRLTDEITRLEYIKEMDVASQVQFEGAFNSLGSQTGTFHLAEVESYQFTWPSLVLSESEMILTPGGKDNLLATLTCDDVLSKVVRWSSSDEAVVSIDQEGYMTAGKSAGTAIITAEFDFNGKTYSDSCVISVRYAVESSTISKRSLTLKVGQEYTLSVKVSPSNATNTTVTWYSEDPSVATVDENGCVYAIAPGTVVIYSLTDDGYYKSTCEVTVK